MTNVFVVWVGGITDVSGEQIDGGKVAGVFTSEAAAQRYIDQVEETYTYRRHDYEISEQELQS